MTGTGALSAPRWPRMRPVEPELPMADIGPLRSRNPYDICVCGDYRRDHEGGTGPVTFPADQVAGFEPCRGFRLQTRSKAVCRG
jgi:hypothetical protein